MSKNVLKEIPYSRHTVVSAWVGTMYLREKS